MVTEHTKNEAYKLLVFLNNTFNGELNRYIRTEQEAADQIEAWAKAIQDLSTDQLRDACFKAKRIAAEGQKVPNPQSFRRLAFTTAERQFAPAKTEALSPPKIDPDERIKNQARLRNAMDAPKSMRRSLYRKGYDAKAHADALNLAKSEQRSLYAVDMAAMMQNGWSEARERKHRAAWMSLRGNRIVSDIPDRRALYLAGRAPPDHVLNANGDSDSDAWIAEQATARVQEVA